MKLLALLLLPLAVWAAEPTPSLADATADYYRAAAAGLPAAYRAHLADDGIIMFLHARGRAELENAIGTRVSPTAKFFATPFTVLESATHDLGYAWGDYRLELIRKSTGEPVTLHGRYMQVWRRAASGSWQILLENWAPKGDPATGQSPALGAIASATLTGSLHDAETHFTTQAARDGIRPAFLAHVADDASIMFLNARGRAEIERAMSAIPADAHIFAEPAIIAEAGAGDLGFAWGPYRFEATVNEKPFSATGKFVTIWRKTDGQWRIVLDHGTQDPDPAPAAPQKS